MGSSGRGWKLSKVRLGEIGWSYNFKRRTASEAEEEGKGEEERDGIKDLELEQIDRINCKMWLAAMALIARRMKWSSRPVRNCFKFLKTPKRRSGEMEKVEEGHWSNQRKFHDNVCELNCDTARGKQTDM